MPRLAGADASHAWISVWSPEFGWVDFDPTNGLMPRDEHITIAYGRDYDDVSPISGILLGGSEHSVTSASMSCRSPEAAAAANCGFVRKMQHSRLQFFHQSRLPLAKRVAYRRPTMIAVTGDWAA